LAPVAEVIAHVVMTGGIAVGFPGGGLSGAMPPAWAWAALWEEVVFRGWLQPALDRWLRPRWPGLRLPLPCRSGQSARSGLSGQWCLSPGNLLASLAFATLHLVFHPAWLWPGYLVASLALGVARERSGGVALPIALHLAFNLGWWALGMLQFRVY
jgi:membrane protease YdiL (CAAX protease family)